MFPQRPSGDQRWPGALGSWKLLHQLPWESARGSELPVWYRSTNFYGIKLSFQAWGGAGVGSGPWPTRGWSRNSGKGSCCSPSRLTTPFRWNRPTPQGVLLWGAAFMGYRVAGKEQGTWTPRILKHFSPAVHFHNKLLLHKNSNKKASCISKLFTEINPQCWSR